jgi:hypothetical protein
MAGERDVTALSALARGRMRSKRAELEDALQGYLTLYHSFLLAEHLSHMDYLDEAIERVSAMIEQHVVDDQEAINCPQRTTGVSPWVNAGTETNHFR